MFQLLQVLQPFRLSDGQDGKIDMFRWKFASFFKNPGVPFSENHIYASAFLCELIPASSTSRCHLLFHRCWFDGPVSSKPIPNQKQFWLFQYGASYGAILRSFT